MNHTEQALLAALRRMLDAFYEDPFEADQQGAVEQAREAIDMARGWKNEWPQAFRDAQAETYRNLARYESVNSTATLSIRGGDSAQD